MSATKLWSRESSAVWRGDCLNAEHVAAVMGDRKADALVFDAPYSPKCHEGHDQQVKSLKDSFAANVVGGRRTREQTYAARVAAGTSAGRRGIDYAAWTDAEVSTFCSLWLPRLDGWAVTITDHVLAPAWESAFAAGGMYVFPPLPLVETGSRVRMAGDGPSGWTCWVVVARPRGEPYSKWGTLRGAYVVPGDRAMNSNEGSERVVGGKPLLAMQCIVADYSRRGDLVVDPVSGGGTTGRAALAQGREFIGMEQDEGRAALTVKACAAVNVSQLGMFGEVGT